MGREESDGREVPQGRRKASETAARRGGKATTASWKVSQLDLFSETADSPKGDTGEADGGQPPPATCELPKSEDTERSGSLPTMKMEEVAHLENLRRAFERVESNDGAPGPDRQAIAEVRERLGVLLPALSQDLLQGNYRPGLVRRVYIPKGGGGQRGLGIPNVVDRIVQQAVSQVLSPHYEPTFHPSSHGFRPERSCHTAIAEARGYLEDGYPWVVDLDLEKFFDRVHHDRLVARLEQRIKDRRLLDLIRKMLKARVVMPDGVLVRSEEGVPQGGPLSPLLSNIVLDELDWELARRGLRFVRYADDCNVYVGSQRAGQRVMDNLTRFIEGRLRLKVNLSKSAVARPEERHFLGFRLRREPHSGETEVYLSKRTIDRAHQKIRELTPRNWGQSLRDCIRGLNAYLTGWFGFFRICTEAGAREFQSLDGRIRRRLRAIVLKQWKSKRIQAKQLIRLGVNRWLVWNTLYKGRRSLWFLSHTEPVDRGLRTAYFAKRGLVSLTVRWKETIAKPVVAPARKRRARATAGSNASVGSRD